MQYGPTTNGASERIDPELRTFDTATGLWCIVVGAIVFLYLIRRGLRPVPS